MYSMYVCMYIEYLRKGPFNKDHIYPQDVVPFGFCS